MSAAFNEVAWSLLFTTSHEDATCAFGAALASVARGGDVVLLVGDLGAGKTTLARGYAEGLGIEGPVTSPTFTLVREYPCPPGRGVDRLVHADLYRLGSLEEVADVGLDQLAECDAVTLVEWGGTGAQLLGPDVLVVSLEPADGVDERIVRLCGMGPRWADRRHDVEGALGAFGSFGP